jgi:hypothetical protein
MTEDGPNKETFSLSLGPRWTPGHTRQDLIPYDG